MQSLGDLPPIRLAFLLGTAYRILANEDPRMVDHEVLFVVVVAGSLLSRALLLSIADILTPGPGLSVTLLEAVALTSSSMGVSWYIGWPNWENNVTPPMS
jgi:hypothetical protein